MSMSKVNFVGGTQALFNAIVEKDPNTLYFITDSQRIYKGDVDCTKSVFPVTVFPKNGLSNKIYIHKNTLEVKIYSDGTWLTVAPGYVTTLEDFNNPEKGDRLASVNTIKEYIDSVLDARVASLIQSGDFDPVEGNVRLYGTDTENPISTIGLYGVAHDAEYDTSNMKITIPQYGKQDLVIDLPKDNFLSDAYFKKDYDFGDHIGPAIVLVVKAGDEGEEKEIPVPADSMENDYTGGKTDSIQVEITDEHKVKARIIIDKNTADGVLMIWDESNKKIGTVGVKINNNPEAEMGDSNESIPTAAVIAAAINKAATEITGNLVGEGAENEVIISTETGIVRSGIIIGGAVLSEMPNATTLATEAAVLDAISWKTLA